MSEITITAAGLRIVKLLVGNPPQTVAQLVRQAGVTRTAVTEQLDELMKADFVERKTERTPGRGRPRHLYRATDSALSLLFAGNQHLLVPALWQTIREIGGDELVEKVIARTSHTMAKYYDERITAKNPRERLNQLIDLLSAEGRLVDVLEDDGGVLTLHKRSCPFISMADPQLYVCRVDEEMLCEVVGRPVRRISCRHEGGHCCSFEIDVR
ncbi:MAG: MarR family transcriptional regulator [Pirellulaceae bacterium]|nr:MarR family transcriptional regulator [Pirellulaceae bacterium]